MSHRLSRRKKKAFQWKIIIASAFAVMLAITAIFLIPRQSDSEITDQQQLPSAPSETPAPHENITTLLLRLNPQILFEVDENDRVLSVTGANEDGVALLEGVDFTDYSFENAAITVVNLLIQHNYITVTEIEQNITLTLSGESRRTSLIDEMSAIIKSAAEPYEFTLNTQQTSEDTLEILLESPSESSENTTETLPSAEDSSVLPDNLKITFLLTGKVNRPEDIGLQEDGIFQAGYTEVSDVQMTFDGGKTYPAHKIVNFDTAGDWLTTSVFQVLHSLIQKDYISNDLHGKITISLPKCTAGQYDSVTELTSLILEEARLHLTVAESDSRDSFFILPSDSEPTPSETAVYTMAELLNLRLNKDIALVTPLQKRILSIAYTEYGAEEKLKPRYWAVIPDFVGMDRDAALELCTQTGFIPQIVDEYDNTYDSDTINQVIYQDCPPGYTMQVGMPIQLNIATDQPEPDIKM